MELDPYIVRTLMRDLVGHDRAPSAYLLYVWLWGNTRGLGRRELGCSLHDMAIDTGLSKSSTRGVTGRPAPASTACWRRGWGRGGRAPGAG
jgi:hypothetical protein